MGKLVPQLTIPPGTQVVIRRTAQATSGAAIYPAGAVGVVGEAPASADAPYLVRFADGGEAALGRAELLIRALHQAPEPGPDGAAAFAAYAPYIRKHPRTSSRCSTHSACCSPAST